MTKFYYSHNQMLNDLEYICKQMDSQNWKPDLIIAPVRGGLIPSVYISHYFDAKICPINLSLRDFIKAEIDEVDLAKNIDGFENILVIDDIVDTGETFSLLKKSFNSINPDLSIKYSACFFNKSNEFKVDLDFYGHVLDKQVNNVWVVFPFEDWNQQV